jgi:hypothetical protein
MTYTNMILYSAAIQSYSPKKDEERGKVGGEHYEGKKGVQDLSGIFGVKSINVK